MNFKIVFSIFLCLLYMRVHSQEESDNLAVVHFASSPTVANLGIFGEHPVSLSTGIPAVSIPIHTIKVGSIRVPISLDYHASGVKVKDRSGLYGVKWSLNGLGMISAIKTKSRLSSENKTGVKKITRTEMSQMTVNQIGDFLYDNRTYDFEPHSFQYTLPDSRSGKIFIDGDLNSFFVPLQHKMKVEHLENDLYGDEYFDPETNVTTSWSDEVITDDQGVKYYFGTQEYKETFFKRDNAQVPGDENTLLSTSSEISAAFLDSIVSPHGHKVYFEYEPNNYSIPYEIISQKEREWNSAFQGPITEYTAADYNSHRLKSITTDHERVVFIFREADAVDDNYGSGLLEKISIETLEGHVVRSYQIHYVHNGRYNVSKVECFGVGGLEKEYDYEFGYKAGFIEGSDHFGVDYFGYHNGVTTNSSLLPQQISAKDNGSEESRSGDSDRSVGSMEETQRGILDQIVYPTGGKTEFEYEPNFSRNSVLPGDPGGGNYLSAGVRIKEIRNYNLDGTLVKTTSYTYEPGTLTYGNDFISNTNFSGCDGSGIITLWWSSIHSQPIRSLGASSSWVVYDHVTEKVAGNGYTEYDFYNPIDDFTPTGAPWAFINTFKVSKMDRSYRRGRIREKRVYKEGSVNPIIRETYSYRDESEEFQYLDGMVFKKDNYYSDASSFQSYAYHGTKIINPNGPCHLEPWAFEFYSIESNYIDIASKIVTDYAEGQELTSITNYTYNSQGYLSETKTTLPDNEEIFSKVKYPGDYGTASGSAIDESRDIQALREANILSAPVEEIEGIIKANIERVTAGKLNQYENLLLEKTMVLESATPINNFQLSEVTNGAGFSFEDTYYTDQVIVDEYGDKGTILQATYHSGITESYHWGYHDQFPVAKVINATKDDFAMANFEEDQNVSWGCAFCSYHEDAFTGKRSVEPTVTRELYLNRDFSSGNYRLDLRAKVYSEDDYGNSTNTTIYVDGYPDPNQLMHPGDNSWKYSSMKLFIPTGTTQLKLIIPEGVIIDDLRLFPIDSEIQTYTYDPLIGITSYTDTNGTTQIYRYDKLGRLEQVLDQDGDIIKQYSYFYETSEN